MNESAVFLLSLLFENMTSASFSRGACCLIACDCRASMWSTRFEKTLQSSRFVLFFNRAVEHQSGTLSQFCVFCNSVALTLFTDTGRRERAADRDVSGIVSQLGHVSEHFVTSKLCWPLCAIFVCRLLASCCFTDRLFRSACSLNDVLSVLVCAGHSSPPSLITIARSLQKGSMVRAFCDGLSPSSVVSRCVAYLSSVL